MFEYLAMNIVRDVAVMIGLGLTGTIFTQAKIKIKKRGK